MSHYALTILCPPTAANTFSLSDTQALAKTNGQPETARTLGPGAFEYTFEAQDLSAASAHAHAVRTELAGLTADINSVAITDRRKSLLIADMDSTMIEQECIDEIAVVAGVGERVADITERAMRGELDFEAALNERVGLLKGLPEDTLQSIFEERIKIMPGARTLIQTMKKSGAFCALVSGGFTFFTARVAKVIGFDSNQANSLESADGKLTGHVVPPILGKQAKLDALNTLVQKMDLPISKTLAVGDGANDLAMITAAGLGVAYHAKPIVAKEADAQVIHNDLTALLYLQGYTHKEFA